MVKFGSSTINNMKDMPEKGKWDRKKYRLYNCCMPPIRWQDKADKCKFSILSFQYKGNPRFKYLT